MRRYNLENLYKRYVAQFEKTKTRLSRKKGLSKEVWDAPMMSIEDFEFKIEKYKRSRTKATGFTNITRQIATDQFYPRTIEQAINLRFLLQSKYFNITSINGLPLTIENLRLFGLGALNEALKEKGKKDSYERAEYISQYVYDSY